MRLVKISHNDIENIKFYKKTYYTEIIEEFLDSDMMFAEIKDYKCKDAYSCTFNMCRALQRMKVSNVKCYTYKGKVLMEKVGFGDEHTD